MVQDVWVWSGRSPELPLLSSWGLGIKSPDLPRSRMRSQQRRDFGPGFGHCSCHSRNNELWMVASELRPDHPRGETPAHCKMIPPLVNLAAKAGKCPLALSSRELELLHCWSPQHTPFLTQPMAEATRAGLSSPGTDGQSQACSG